MDAVFYTLSQVSKMTNMSESTIKRRIKEGLIPRSKLCGRILIPASFVNRLSGENEQIVLVNKN